MRLLVVGAGASYAEARNAGLPEELCPPLMKNFATRLWAEYNPHFLLAAYLQEVGYDSGNDARATFIALERAQSPNISVERFFEFAYHHRDFVVPGHEKFQPTSEYDNLLLHGILNPFVFLLVQGLFKDGVETTPLPLAQTMASHLRAGDMVLNLNYETIFEIGARQAGHELLFLPNRPSKTSLAISKPHGSMNLFVRADRRGFFFVEPLFNGSLQMSTAQNYIGFVPPRLNKQYAQHPIANAIIAAMQGIQPTHVIFWGVGMTDSDKDLLELYKIWCHGANSVDFINPSVDHVNAAMNMLAVDANRYNSVADWESGLEPD